VLACIREEQQVLLGRSRVEQRHVTAFWNLVLGLVDDAGSVVDVVDRD
jgi:hypothetical protein